MPDRSAPDPDKPAEERAFFGRSRGKALRPGQAHQIADVLPRLRMPAEGAIGDLAALFPKPMRGYRMEIGFGGGEHLLHAMRLEPEIGFIGCEPFVNGMAKFLAAIERDGLSNIRLWDQDAARLLPRLPVGSLERVDLFYPDPWPKKKHWKRRFVSAVNLERISKVLKRGGSFRFASDIDTYVNWTLLHCRAHGGFDWLAEDARDWHGPYEGWPGTRYEAKALREGRRPAYLTFRRR